MALARSGACPRFFCLTGEYPCRIFNLCSVIDRGTPVMCFGSHAKISRFLCKSAHTAALPVSDSDPPIDTSCSGAECGGVVDGDNSAVDGGSLASRGVDGPRVSLKILSFINALLWRWRSLWMQCSYQFVSDAPPSMYLSVVCRDRFFYLDGKVAPPLRYQQLTWEKRATSIAKNCACSCSAPLFIFTFFDVLHQVIQSAFLNNCQLVDSWTPHLVVWPLHAMITHSITFPRSYALLEAHWRWFGKFATSLRVFFEVTCQWGVTWVPRPPL
ncbi:hypothetical protein Tco_0044691 [Tanacetum coccineum]